MLIDVILFLFIKHTSEEYNKLFDYSKIFIKFLVWNLQSPFAYIVSLSAFHQPPASHNKMFMLETWHYWEVVTDDNFPRLNCPIVREDDWFTSQPIEPTEKFLSWKSSHVGKVPMLEKFLCWKSFNNGKVSIMEKFQ